MNKHLLATFITFSTVPFLATAQIQPSRSNPTKGRHVNKQQLLKHLKNVRFTLQKHLKTAHDRWEELMMEVDDCESQEDIEEVAGMIFCTKLCDDFYKSSIHLQQKTLERVIPAFNFICTHIKPLTLDEISHHLLPYAKSKFDKNTTRQLQTLLQSLFTKHCQIYRNSNLPSELTEMSIDEIFEQCIWFILDTNDLALYESTVLLQKVDAKIKELECA